MKACKFIFGLLLLLIFANAYCQDQTERQSIQVYVGLSLGRSDNSFHGSAIDNRVDPYYSPETYFEGHKAYFIEVQSKVLFLDYFFLRQGIAFLTKGDREINSRFSYSVDAEMKFISLPLSIGFQPINFYNTEWLTVYVEGGIVPNFMLKMNSEDIKKGYLETPDINNFSWAYQLGAGFEIRLFKKFAITGGYTYMKDFTPFFEIYKNHPDHYDMLNKTALIKIGAMMKIN